MDDRSLRILLIGDYPADATLGSPKVLYKLRDAFAADGHEVTLLLRPDLGESPRQRHLRDAASPLLAWRAVQRLVGIGQRFDVIDASSAEGLIVARRRVRTRQLRETGIIARSHGLEHLNYARMLDDARHGITPRPWYRRVWYPMTRMRMVARAATLADRLIVANESDRAFAIDQGWKQAAEVAVISHGVAPAFFVDDSHRPARGQGLLFCGSWDAVKGVTYLARAFGDLTRRRPDVHLTVLGPGRDEASVLAAFDAEARSRVRVIPRVPEEAVLHQYLRHDALVMCSTFEGFGMVVPEAMAAGLPVIATPAGAAATLVRDGETGLVVPMRDAVALSDAMDRMMGDPALRQRLARNARAEVSALTWANTARRTIDEYRSVLGPAGVANGALA